MIIEAAIAGATATMLGAFWLAHKIVRATLEDEERAEKREDERAERDRPSTPVTPEIARAARAAVAEKRRILIEQLDQERNDAAEWKTKWHANDCMSDFRLKNFNSATTNAHDIEKQLLTLADEEAKIPLFDDESSK